MVNQPDPFDETKIAEFYPILGQIIIAWSRIERALDLAIHSANRPDLADDKSGKRLVAFSRKIIALRRICKEFPPFDAGQNTIRQLIDEIVALSDIRKVLVHGYFDGLQGTNPETIKITAVRYEQKSQKMETLTISTEALTDVMNRMDRANDALFLKITLPLVVSRGKSQTALQQLPQV